MNEPKLKDVYIQRGVYAHQKGRVFILVDDEGKEIPEPVLSRHNKDLLEFSRWRLADAWRCYDAALEAA